MIAMLLYFSVIGIFILGIFLYALVRQLSRINSKLSTTELLLAKEMDKEQAHDVEMTLLKNKIETNNLNDALTGLPNRTFFENQLHEVLKQSAQYNLHFAIMFLNLDGFKIINDALGLTVGDELLKEVAKRLRLSTRQVDSVSRFAGDEFVFILTQIKKPEAAVYIAKRLLETIAEPFPINDQEIFITASIGIAVYPEDGLNVESLLKNADNALHQAKLEGRNNYQFYRQEIYDLNYREFTLRTQLRNSAIFNEFVIYYQPEINIETQKIISMEAILHWNHPKFGLLHQNDFLPFAENNGNMESIGDWLLRETCQQMQEWKYRGFNPQNITLKIAAKQLENTHFIFKVSQTLQEMQLKPSELIFEISEIVLLSKWDSIEKSLHMLRQLGVQIGVSGFGTGKISLQDLRDLPIDYLKIATSLIKDIVIDKESAAIVKMIITLGNTLGLRVIAEGIDTAEQKELLMAAGCLFMQGNLFSAPLLPQDCAKIFESSMSASS